MERKNVKQRPQAVAVYRSALALFAFLMLAQGAAAGETQTGKLEKDGITIEYPVGLEALAEEVHPWLLERLSKPEGSEQVRLSALMENEQEMLTFIARQLAMEKPGEHMQKVFRIFAKNVQEVFASLPDPTDLRLWPKEELDKFIKNGGNLPGYDYDPATGKVRGSVSMRLGQQEPLKRLSTPIVLHQKDNEKMLIEVKKKLGGLLTMRASVRATLAATACHETAEIAMTVDLDITGAYRRWFVEGMANVIASACLQKFFSKEAVSEYLKGFSVEPYLGIKRKVNLGSWLAKEFAREPKSAVEKQLEAARYAFATYEIMGLINRHGAEVIPKVFAELQKGEVRTRGKASLKAGPRGPELDVAVLGVRDSAAIFNAIEKVTGEDFRARMLAYTE